MRCFFEKFSNTEKIHHFRNSSSDSKVYKILADILEHAGQIGAFRGMSNDNNDKRESLNRDFVWLDEVSRARGSRPADLGTQMLHSTRTLVESSYD